MSKGIKLISEKVSYKEEGNLLRIVILGKIERWKEGLLAAWLVAWVFCGGVVIYQWTQTTNQEAKLGFFIFTVFWAYFLWKVGRTWLFRRGGNELIEVDEEALSLKKSFFGYGKSKSYFLENISEFGPVELSPNSFAAVYERGWWILGGEKLAFKYNGRFVRFSMQTDEKETSRIYTLIRSRLSRNLKTKS